MSDPRNELDVVATLQDLVRLPSVNPMGRDIVDDHCFEHRVTAYLQRYFSALGVPWETVTIAPQRENIYARLDGDTDQIIVFEAHQDTVPIDGMTIDPFGGEVRDGRVWGRGACDIKGGLAAMLTAFTRLCRERPAGRPTLVMACSVNEEHGFSGAREMAQEWASGRSRVVPRRPDAVVVAEPTLLDTIVAHKGVVRWRMVATGVAAHSSRPELGRNAIYRMAAVLRHLEVYAGDVVGGLFQHPRLTRPTFSVGLIEGGLSVNTVPDRCQVEVDRRVLPGENAMAARQHVIDYVANQLGRPDWLEHQPPYIYSDGLSDANNGAVAAWINQAKSRLGMTGNTLGVPYGTDAPAFCVTGVPTVVLGPGSIDQAHTCDEWVAIDQLRQAVELYVELAKTAPSFP